MAPFPANASNHRRKCAAVGKRPGGNGQPGLIAGDQRAGNDEKKRATRGENGETVKITVPCFSQNTIVLRYEIRKYEGLVYDSGVRGDDKKRGRHHTCAVMTLAPGRDRPVSPPDLIRPARSFTSKIETHPAEEEPFLARERDLPPGNKQGRLEERGKSAMSAKEEGRLNPPQSFARFCTKIASASLRFNPNPHPVVQEKATALRGAASSPPFATTAKDGHRQKQRRQQIPQTAPMQCISTVRDEITQMLYEPALNVKSTPDLASFAPMVTLWSCVPYFSCQASMV